MLKSTFDPSKVLWIKKSPFELSKVLKSTLDTFEGLKGAKKLL